MKRRNFFKKTFAGMIALALAPQLLTKVKPIQRPYFFIGKHEAVTASAYGITVKSKTTPFGTFHFIEHPLFQNSMNVKRAKPPPIK